MTDYTDLLEWLDNLAECQVPIVAEAAAVIRQLIAERDAEIAKRFEGNRISSEEHRDEITTLKTALRETGKALEDLYLGFDRTREWGCLPMELVRAKAAIVAINEVLK